MKKNNTAKKAVLPALLAVLCSTAALTSVSYAWFTIGTTASVDEINVDVQAAKGMQISADATTWKSQLPVSELDNGVNDMLTGKEYKPLSSALNVTNGNLDLFYGEVQKDGGIVATDDSSGKHVVFDFYVNLTVAKDFYLDEKSSVLSDNGSHMAARVAFIHEGTVASDAEDLVTTAKGLTNGVEAKVWEPNATTHYAADVSGAKDYLGVNQKIAYTSGARPATYNECFTEIKGQSLLRPTYGQDGLTTEATKLFSLEAGISKIRVYIWLEGQDVDCINNVSGGKLNTKLNFKVNE